MTEQDRRVTALTALALDAKQEVGSYAKLAARCVDPKSGRAIGASWMHRLATDTADPPETWKLRAMAVGFGKPLATIKQAAAQQYFDYRSDDLAGLPEDARAIVTHLGAMTDEDLERLRRIVEAYGGD